MTGSQSLRAESSNKSSNNSTDALTNNNGVIIAWFALIGLVALCLVALGLVYAYRLYRNNHNNRSNQLTVNRQGRRRQNALQEAERVLALARIQRNVCKFVAAQQNTIQTRNLCALLGPQTTILGQEEDLQVFKQGHGNVVMTLIDMTSVTEQCDEVGAVDGKVAGHVDKSAATVTSGCLICLEDWRAGDCICQSAGCRHAFHQTCIVSWLVHHRADCPACRQAFLPRCAEPEDLGNNNSSNNNNDEGEEYEA